MLQRLRWLMCKVGLHAWVRASKQLDATNETYEIIIKRNLECESMGVGTKKVRVFFYRCDECGFDDLDMWPGS